MLLQVRDFDGWREQARRLLVRQVAPERVSWCEPGQDGLFGVSDQVPDAGTGFAPVRIPARALEALRMAARFRTAARWNLLYRVLWRLHQGDRSAWMAGDEDGAVLQRRIKAVRREVHHLHAFARFQPLQGEGDLDLICWHEPAHDILDLACVHFVHRLGRRRWVIATPEDGAGCDGERLHYVSPCPPVWQELARSVRDRPDGLWQTYYASIFNPARLNPQVMQGHMPARFWTRTLEGQLVPELVVQARLGGQRVGQVEGVRQQAGKRIRLPHEGGADRPDPD